MILLYWNLIKSVKTRTKIVTTNLKDRCWSVHRAGLNGLPPLIQRTAESDFVSILTIMSKVFRKTEENTPYYKTAWLGHI